MERRSRRGRPSFAERYEPEPTPGPSTGRGRASGKGTATATSSKVIEAAVATITPQPAAPEEVVLNARGMVRENCNTQLNELSTSLYACDYFRDAKLRT